MKKKVLSISGGGIRGIIPAVILIEIEKRCQKPVCEIFDLIAGTSTGGLLALGLSLPDFQNKPKYSAEDMLQLYFKEGQKIFNRSGWYAIRSGWSIFDAKFQAEGIEEVLQSYFGEARLKDVLTEVLITSYETQDIVKPWFFKSARAKKDASYDFPLKLVGRATSAAPTYFEPAIVEKNGFSEGLNFIDGGVFANNPSMCAYVEAKNLFPDEEVMLVSLGTGALTRKISYEESKDWGVAEWARPILNVVFDGVADTIHYQLSQLLGKEQYMQFEVSLKDGGSDDMDDASLTNMRVLKNLAEELIQKREDDLDKLCEILIK